MSHLKEYYKKEIVPKLQKDFDLKNIVTVPKIEKIVLNVGAGEAVHNHKAIDFIVNDLTLISGQKPVTRRAKKSIAGFKLREGMIIGVMVTLRRDKMYDFLFRLINICLPRERDFKGLSYNAFDKSANYTIGIKEQLIFPEINFDKTDKIRGLSITIVTSTNDLEQSKALLSGMGLPFRKANN